VSDTYGYLDDFDYSYMWYPFIKTDPYLVLSWLDPGTYPVIVEVTGCPADVVRDTMILTINPCDLTIPNVITPNGDLVNDVFYIPNVEYYPNSTMVIYNRWGRKVYESTNYQGDWNGENCADGVYFWVFTINYGDRGNGTEYKQQNGTLTIMR
jgi:gliding motility-associated-like protein